MRSGTDDPDPLKLFQPRRKGIVRGPTELPNGPSCPNHLHSSIPLY